MTIASAIEDVNLIDLLQIEKDVLKSPPGADRPAWVVVSDQNLPFFSRALQALAFKAQNPVQVQSLFFKKIGGDDLQKLTSQYDRVVWVPTQQMADVEFLKSQDLQKLICIPPVLQSPLFLGALDWANPDSELQKCWNTHVALQSNPEIRDIVIRSFAAQMEIGFEKSIDPRLKFETSMPYSVDFQIRLAEMVLQQLQFSIHGQKKVVAVDFDGTLWDGILGEGTAHVDPETAQGRSFLAFQDFLLSLRSKGFLLVGLSKNDTDFVNAEFDSVPFSRIRLSDFAQVLANWNDKSANLEKIASNLNLLPEHFCFVDDSKFEIEQMQHQLPEVACLHLDSNTQDRVASLAQKNWFWKSSLTTEDKKRADFYSPQKRQKFSAADLQTELSLELLAENEIERAHQLLQKTNQFNFTCDRLTWADLKDRVASPDYEVFRYTARDQVEDLGFIGLVIVRKTSQHQVLFENWVMSCRAFHRNIENQILERLLQKMRSDGFTDFKLRYVPQNRNSKARQFIEDIGFHPTSQNEIWSQNAE